MDLRAHTRRYCRRDNRLASLSYFSTLAIYFLSLTFAIAFAQAWYILLPAGMVFAVSAVRLYVLQHDTGHHSLFETRLQNECAGHLLSIFTFAPFEVMKQNHNLHHGGISNLEHRETGEIFTMTLREWEQATVLQRIGYRCYRNPFVLVTFGALFTYFIRYRWPKNTMHFGAGGVILHNIVIASFLWGLYRIGDVTAVLIWLTFSFLGGMLGVFLVYLQHNFEDTYWDRRPDLDPVKAALSGASCLDFGWFFDLAVANITLHDLHHFNARIPSYRLRQCHYAIPPEYAPRRIKFPEALRALTLKLWDEKKKRLVPFPSMVENVQ
ncbi:omega-6 fatty acid desaturase (delta-12 desaturase) [Epibacterium ulvae]|uniref:Omega-6 fatty acid desaturase (Delta-12 desaturase) n=1 Tax=Epibacterium ulvae TaxID=1156985 RepID=A0A1G5Q1S3_9RHOB|nr:fatty acid desaturase [Epibacterium ulvae]SCZ55753.1 omega-6 fatty acid desaturase (delta-12 desaturase) [Epibacterium ulvae]